MENNQVDLTDINVEGLSTSSRVYNAPRLDDAIDYQRKNVKHGKITLPIITILSFLGGYFGVFCAIGLVSYWLLLIRNKDQLEKIEKELFRENKEDGLIHDISSMKLFWFKFGPVITYVTSVLSAIYLVFKWFLSRD